MPFLSWGFNNGEKVQFWKDSWNDYTSLISIQELQPPKQILSNIWGSKLKYYVHKLEPIIGRFLWKDLSNSPMSTNQKSILQKFLGERCVFLSASLDRVIWEPSKDDNYIVK